MSLSSPEYLAEVIKSQSERISALEARVELLKGAIRAVRDDEGETLGEDWVDYFNELLNQAPELSAWLDEDD